MNKWMSEWLINWMNEWMNEWVNEWKNEWVIIWTSQWVNEWMNEWLFEWLFEWMSEWVKEWVSDWVNESVSEWMNEWMNEWVDEWMNEWMNEGEWVNEWLHKRASPLPITADVSGCSPTPHVTWIRIGRDMPVRHRLESFGQRLTIDNVQYEDEGRYECQGVSESWQVPVRRSMHLDVECEYIPLPFQRLQGYHRISLWKFDYCYRCYNFCSR